MNTKRFLMIAALVALSMNLFALVVTTTSIPAKVQAKTNISSLIPGNEPAVRMQSGAIQLSDSNAPDFRLHMKPAENERKAEECIKEDSAPPRRRGGCIQ